VLPVVPGRCNTAALRRRLQPATPASGIRAIGRGAAPVLQLPAIAGFGLTSAALARLPSRASPLPQCPGLIKECVHTTNPWGSGLAREGVRPDNVYLRANPQQSPVHCPASSPPATTPSRSTDKSPSPDAVVGLPGCPPDPAAECSPTKREVAAGRRLVDREDYEKTGAPEGALRTATIECGDREYPT